MYHLVITHIWLLTVATSRLSKWLQPYLWLKQKQEFWTWSVAQSCYKIQWIIQIYFIFLVIYIKKSRDIIFSRLWDICILLGSSYTHKWEASAFNLKRLFLIKNKVGITFQISPYSDPKQPTISQGQTANSRVWRPGETGMGIPPQHKHMAESATVCVPKPYLLFMGFGSCC